MKDQSIFELESELFAELPTRNLMCRRRHVRRHHHSRAGTSASANNGSGANSAKQNTYIVPVQIAISNGGSAKNKISGGITVSQALNQQNQPTNLSLG